MEKQRFAGHGRSNAIFHYKFQSPFRLGDRVRVRSERNGSGDGVVDGYGLTSERYVFHFVEIAADYGLGGIDSQEMERLDGTATVAEVRVSSEYGLAQRVVFRDEGVVKQGIIDVVCLYEEGLIGYVVLNDDGEAGHVPSENIIRAISD